MIFGSYGNHIRHTSTVYMNESLIRNRKNRQETSSGIERFIQMLEEVFRTSKWGTLTSQLSNSIPEPGFNLFQSSVVFYVMHYYMLA